MQQSLAKRTAHWTQAVWVGLDFHPNSGMGDRRRRVGPRMAEQCRSLNTDEDLIKRGKQKRNGQPVRIFTAFLECRATR